MDGIVFYHDLQCRSGLGDRLLDLWAACTIVRLHEPGAPLEALWHEGNQFATFVGSYATDAFGVSGCRFVVQPPPDALSMDARFSHSEFNSRGMVRLENGVVQVVLRTGRIWGNTCPEGIHADLAFYGLDPRIALAQVIDTYCEVAASTTVNAAVSLVAPSDLDRRVGVHVRLGDKLVTNETSTDMSPETWCAIERDVLAYLERCIALGVPLFVCSDDPVYSGALIDHLRSRGGDVVASDPACAPAGIPGAGALVDFCALSRCARIVQASKHSTFSLSAALAGRTPLVNFYRDDKGIGNRIEIWLSALARAGVTLASHDGVRRPA